MFRSRKEDSAGRRRRGSLRQHGMARALPSSMARGEARAVAFLRRNSLYLVELTELSMRSGPRRGPRRGKPEAPKARIATVPGNGERLTGSGAVAVALKHMLKYGITAPSRPCSRLKSLDLCRTEIILPPWEPRRHCHVCLCWRRSDPDAPSGVGLMTRSRGLGRMARCGQSLEICPGSTWIAPKLEAAGKSFSIRLAHLGPSPPARTGTTADPVSEFPSATSLPYDAKIAVVTRWGHDRASALMASYSVIRSGGHHATKP